MQAFIDGLLPIAISIIMIGIGMELTIDDFKRVFVEPKAVLYGLFGQMVLVSTIGFIIAFVFPLEPVHQIGLILLAASPGGTSSNIVSYMLNGKVALSVSMTAFNSFLVVFTIPLILQLAFHLFWEDSLPVQLSMSDTFFDIFFTVLIPVLIGLAIRHFFPRFSEFLKQPLKFLLPGILFAVFALILWNESGGEGANLLDYWPLFIPALFLNIAVMFVGFYSSGWMGIDHKGKYTIAIEMGLQNSALAIYLANNVLQVGEMAIVAVLYGGFSFFSTLGVAYLMKNHLKTKLEV